MSIDIPPALQWISYLAGSKWPQGDEDGLWRIGEHWKASAAEMSDLIPDLNRVRNETMSVITGETADTAEQEFAKLFDGDYSVDKLVEAMKALGETARQAGTQVEASKIEILVGLAMAAAEIIYAIAMAPWTFGASMAWIPPIEMLTMAAIRMLFSQLMRALVRRAIEALTKTAVARLLREVAQETVEEVVEELVVNLSIQQYQVDKGHKDKIDWNDAATAAKGAAAGGAAAGAFHGPAFGALGGKHGKGGIGNAAAGAGASYGSEVVAGVVGAVAVGGNLDAGEIFAGGALGAVSGGIDSSHGDGHEAPHGSPTGLDGGRSHAFDSGDKGPDGGPDGPSRDGEHAQGPGGEKDTAPPPDEQTDGAGPSGPPQSSTSDSPGDSNTADAGAPQARPQDGPAPQAAFTQSTDGPAGPTTAQHGDDGGPNDQTGSTQPSDSQSNPSTTQQGDGGDENVQTAPNQSADVRSETTPAPQQAGNGPDDQTGSHPSSIDRSPDDASSQQPDRVAGPSDVHSSPTDEDSHANPEPVPTEASSAQPAPQQVSSHDAPAATDTRSGGGPSESPSAPQNSSTSHSSDPGPDPAPDQAATPSQTPTANAQTPPPVADHSAADNSSPPASAAAPDQPSAGQPRDNAAPQQDGAHSVDGSVGDHPSSTGPGPSDTDSTASRPNPPSAEPHAGASTPPATTPVTPSATNPSAVTTTASAAHAHTGTTPTAATQSATTTPSSSSPGTPVTPNTPTGTPSPSSSPPPAPSTADTNKPAATAKSGSAGLGTSSNSAPAAVSNVANSTAATPTTRSESGEQSDVAIAVVATPAVTVPTAPPAPPLRGPREPGPRVGGPPAASAPKGARNADIINDESWRHDPARSADWFTPRDPAPEQTWRSRRDGAHVRSVDTVVADVLTDSTPAKINAYDGLVRYDLRRIEVTPGRFVQEYTVKVHLRPGTDVDADTVAGVAERARQGVDNLLNQGFRLPSGDQFHLNLEFTDVASDAHTVIEVGTGDTDQKHWPPKATANVLAHETLHYLGVPDEYADPQRVFLRDNSHSGVHHNDGGMMGRDVLGDDPGLRPRHLWLVERAANSQVSVPDTRLDTGRPAPANDVDTADSHRGVPTRTRPAPKRGPHDDTDISRKFKRLRTDDDAAMDVDSEVTTDPDAARTSDSDMPMKDVSHGPDAGPQGRPVALPARDAKTTYNQAFENMAGDKAVIAPTGKTYLADLKKSVSEDKPIAFVVNAIVSASEIHRLPEVVEAITANAKDLDGKVAFVIGVNAREGAGADQRLETALANMADVISRIDHPVALTASTWKMPSSNNLPYGTMRNNMMHSGVNQFAIAAMVAQGNHPYLAVQDFDTGSRNVPTGDHVFNHVAGALATGDGLPPARPLMFSGGYVAPRSDADFDAMVASAEAKRSAKVPTLEQEVIALKEGVESATSEDEKKAAIKELKAAEAELSRYRKAGPKLQGDGFKNDFTRQVTQDMDARVEQAKTNPMLPYTPEPNLFIDAVTTLVDPNVKFGDGGAEFSVLGRSLAQFNAAELGALHDANEALLKKDVASLEDLAQIENERSNFRVDAQTGRHPIRGVSFMTDFKGAAVETDLARIALGYAADGKLPQSHAALTGVADRFFATKGDKKGVSLRGFRDDFGKRTGADREPTHLENDPGAPPGEPKIAAAPLTQREDIRRQLGLTDDSAKSAGESPDTAKKTAKKGKSGDGKPKGTGNKSNAGKKTDAEKKDPGKHNLDASLSTPVPGHPDVVAGIDEGNLTSKAAAAVNLAMSGPDASIQRKFASLKDLATRTFRGDKDADLYTPPPPASGGLYDAVAHARGGSAGTFRADLTSYFAGPDGKGRLADLANYVTDHPTTDGDLIKAIIQPGATPAPQLTGLRLDPDAVIHHNPVESDYHPNGAPGEGEKEVPVTDEEKAGVDPASKAQKAEDVRTARNAEHIAITALATQMNATIVLHDTTTGRTTDFRPLGKGRGKRTSTVDLDVTPRSDGRNTYSPHQESRPANRTRRAPSPEDPVTPARESTADSQNVGHRETVAEKKQKAKEEEEQVFGRFDGLEVVPVTFESGKELGGSSGVRLHEVDDRKVAIKPGRGARAVRTEMLAQALFSAIGAPTLQAKPVHVGADPASQKNSRVYLMSDFLEGKMPDRTVHAQFAGHPDIARFAAADMLLSNWDSHKNDAYIASGRRVVRIDVGGSLDLRAQGGVRDDWTEAAIAGNAVDVEEIKPDSRMRANGDGPFKHLTDAQIADSIRTVADRLTPEAIDRALVDTQFPKEDGERLKAVLQARIATALAWANQVYPAVEIKNQSFGKVLGPAPVADAAPGSTVSGPDDRTALEQLVDDFGYRPIVDDSTIDVHKLRWDTVANGEMESSEPSSDTPTNAGVKRPAVLSVRDSPAVTALGPPDYTFKPRVDAKVPAVGPEELLRASQHGDKHARQRFAEHTAMLRGGVLIRRMSEAEVAAFRTALSSNDIDEIQGALFGFGGPPSAPKRGEIVWSLNDTFTFTRELKPDGATGSANTHHNADNYKKVLEIPVTPEMAEKLADHLYISNPVEGAKPAAFQGNPNLKYEGTAGGANDSGGVPNVVVKRNGFADFWSTVRKVRVFDADAHVSANKYEPAAETKEARRRRQQNSKLAEEKKKARQAAMAAPTTVDGDDDLGLSGLMFDDEPAPLTRPAPNADSPSGAAGMPVTTTSRAVRSGGAPPPRPVWTTATGRDVGRDETWRHAPVSSAEWFDPTDPVHRPDWTSAPGAGREDVPVTRVAADVADIRTDSAPSDPQDHYRGLIRYDLRRFEIAPGRFVQEYTVRLGVHAGADYQAREEVKQRVTEGVDRLLNRGYRLPGGDQFHLNLELVDVDAAVDPSSSPARQAHDWDAARIKAGVHQIVQIGDFEGNDQAQWRTDATADVLAHEVLHYLGVPDEYRDADRALLRHGTNSGVHDADGGMMGVDVLDGGSALRPRHLWMVEHVTRSEPRGVFDLPELSDTDRAFATPPRRPTPPLKTRPAPSPPPAAIRETGAIPRLPADPQAHLVLGGMDVVEEFRSGNQALAQIERLVTEQGGRDAWDANRKRLTALFSDDALKPKVTGMLRGGKPVTQVIELGFGRTLTIDLRLDGSPAGSWLQFTESVQQYEFEHSSDQSSAIGSFDENRGTYVGGAQVNLVHPNASHAAGVFGVRERQWSESRQRTDRQISGGQTVEPAARFEGNISSVVSYRLSGPGRRVPGTGGHDTLPAVSFHTEVAVPMRAVTSAASLTAVIAAPPRVASSRALTGADVVTSLQLLTDGEGRTPQSTTGFVTSAAMRSAFESAYGQNAGRAMTEIDDWLSVELLQANLHSMTNKQPLVYEFAGIGGRVEVHAFVESANTPSGTAPASDAQTSNSATPMMSVTGETDKTEFHYGTETDSARVWQDQTTYSAQLPLPGRSRGEGGTPTGEVVGGLDGGLNLSRSTNDVTGSQFRHRNTLKNPVPGQALKGQVRLRFVMHAPGATSPAQRNGGFKGAVRETRAEFDALVEKSEITPDVDYRGKTVHAPPQRIWGPGGPPSEHNSTARHSPRGAVASTPRKRGDVEPLAGLGSMDRVTNLDLNGFHGMLDSMGHRAFGGKWEQVRPTVMAFGHVNRVRSELPAMTQHSPLTRTELSGPGSSNSLALTADIENLTYRRTIGKVMSAPSLENTEGRTTTTISTRQTSGQGALGGRGGDMSAVPVLGEVIGGINHTVRDGSRVREQQRMAVATKFEQPMAIFDGWVRIDATLTGSKVTVHESGLFPVEIAIPLTELQGSRTHDAVTPPTFDRTHPEGFVRVPPARSSDAVPPPVDAGSKAAKPDTPTVPSASAPESPAASNPRTSEKAYTNKPGSTKRPWWSTSRKKPVTTPPPRTTDGPLLDDIADRAPQANQAGGRRRWKTPKYPPLTWTPPVGRTDRPTPPAHALGETWQPTDMLVGLDPASGLVEAIRADLAPALGKGSEKAMAGVIQQFGPQVLQVRLAHQSGQQWSHDIPVPGGRITVKVRAIREAKADYVGSSAKFETDLSIEGQSSTAQLRDDLTRHVEGGRLVVPFPHGSASVQVTHSGSVSPKSAPSAGGEGSDMTPRFESSGTDTEHRIPTRVKSTEAHDLFRQPIRFEISYEKHMGARLLSGVPDEPADVRLAGVFSYPSAPPADSRPASHRPGASASASGIRLGADQVVTEVRPSARQAASPQQPAPAHTPDEDTVAAHVLDSITVQGRQAFGDDWPAVRAELAPHVSTRALHGELGDYSRGAQRTITLKSVKGGEVVLSAMVEAITPPTAGTAKDAEFYTGGQTIQAVNDTNTDTDNWNVTLTAQGTALPVDVGINASVLGRVDVNRATDRSATRTGTSAIGELFRKKATAHVQAGTATVSATMRRPTGTWGNGGRRQRIGFARIDFRTRQSSPDAQQHRHQLQPTTVAGRGLPRGSMVRKIVDGDRLRRQTSENLKSLSSGIAASRLRGRLPDALADIALQRNLPAMTRGEEVEIFRDGTLRITGHAVLTALDFTGVERDGGMTNLLNEINQGDSRQSSSAWEAGARVMAGPHGNLGDGLRGNVMAGGGGLVRSRHGATHGLNAKVSANAKFAGAHAVFDGTARIVLTVHDGDTAHTLPGMEVAGPMLIPASEVQLVPTPDAPAGSPQPTNGTSVAGLSASSTGLPAQPAGSPIARTRRVRRRPGISRATIPELRTVEENAPRTSGR